MSIVLPRSSLVSSTATALRPLKREISSWSWPCRETTVESFGDANFNTVLFTEANFRQYYPPTESDPDGFLPESSVASTVTVFDWVDMAQPGVRYVIYENWPDMAGYTSADFQSGYPSTQELAAYHAYTLGAFHDWWLDYQDAMIEQRPELNVRMVPVGSVLATLLTNELADLPAEVLYEDDAPHGRPTLYFLAGLTTFPRSRGKAENLNFHTAAFQRPSQNIGTGCSHRDRTSAH